MQDYDTIHHCLVHFVWHIFGFKKIVFDKCIIIYGISAPIINPIWCWTKLKGLVCCMINLNATNHVIYFVFLDWHRGVRRRVHNDVLQIIQQFRIHRKCSFHKLNYLWGFSTWILLLCFRSFNKCKMQF